MLCHRDKPSPARQSFILVPIHQALLSRLSFEDAALAPPLPVSTVPRKKSSAGKGREFERNEEAAAFGTSRTGESDRVFPIFASAWVASWSILKKGFCADAKKKTKKNVRHISQLRGTFCGVVFKSINVIHH